MNRKNWQQLPGWKCLFLGGMMLCEVGTVFSQEYPNRPVRIVTSDVGGGADFTARLLSPGLTGGLGQQVIVENRQTNLLGGLVAKAPPDGYTLLLTGGVLWLSPFMRNVPYDPVRDFLPVSMLARSPLVLVVHPSLPVKSVRELIALAKARPGELNYSLGGGIGASPHLASELFRAMAGVKMVGINYKGSGPALNAMIGGEVQLMFTSAGSVASHVKSGRVRALAVTGAQRSPSFPGLPTIAESGLAGYESVSILCILVPAKTPEAVINRLNQEIVRVINQPDIKEKLFNSGVEPVGSTPEQLAAKIKAEMAAMGKVIKDAGIRAE